MLLIEAKRRLWVRVARIVASSSFMYRPCLPALMILLYVLLLQGVNQRFLPTIQKKFGCIVMYVRGLLLHCAKLPLLVAIHPVVLIGPTMISLSVDTERVRLDALHRYV